MDIKKVESMAKQTIMELVEAYVSDRVNGRDFSHSYAQLQSAVQGQERIEVLNPSLVDRSDAVNLALNAGAYNYTNTTPNGVATLCKAILDMDAFLLSITN